MRRWFISGIVLAAAGLSACEDSSSGGARVARIPDSGSSAGTASTPSPQPCATCLQEDCLEPLATCGLDLCNDIIECLFGCADSDACNACLTQKGDPKIVAVASCVRSTCTDACQVDRTAPPMPPSAVSLAASADCGRYAACAPDLIAYQYGSVAACEERLGSLLSWRAALTDSGVTDEALAACGAQLETLSCDAYFSLRPKSDCIIAGKRKNGQPCRDGVQCASGYCPAAAYGCAACAPMPKTGDACKVGLDCPGGTACSAGSCIAVGVLGSTCDAAHPCDAYLVCAAGKCARAPTKAGTACGSSTTAPVCDFHAALLCDSTTSGSCLPFHPVGSGEACGKTTSEVFVCSQLGTCSSGRCTAGPQAGDACTSTGACNFPDQCLNKVCVGVPSEVDCDGATP